MTYTLHRLAAGNYDLILDGIVIGSVVRTSLSNRNTAVWRAELADENWEGWPAPFEAAEHEFVSLDEITDWLGASLVVDPPQRRD